MTIIASLSERDFAVAAHSIPFTVDANATLIQVTLTHPNTLAAWPAGPLIEWDVLWGGIGAGKTTTGGGIRNGKDGLPIIGNVVTVFTRSKPPGFTAGEGRINVLQPLRTAVVVESL